MLPPGLFWVDAHEDLACHCQEYQRELVDPGIVRAMITLPRLMRMGVRLVCATLFVPHTGSLDSRKALLEDQYRIYQRWLESYPQALRLVKSSADLELLAQAEPVEIPRANPGEEASNLVQEGELAYPLGMLLLMEGCDLLSGPADLELWHSRGLRMASLTWNGSNSFASGCFSDGLGLKPAGFELLDAFADLGLILDFSHLNDAGTSDALGHAKVPVCASHSNSRMLCQHERNLTDQQAEEIAARGGVIGLNLLATFVQTGWRPDMRLPELREAVDHLDHLARLCGADKVGLGSDLDGGLTPENTPEGIDTVSDLPLLADELLSRGWTEASIAGFCGANWWAFLERSLPR
ncbi:membrane dipeptidase [bacterium]|nr:membrane dipeptidase [bacterium]